MLDSDIGFSLIVSSVITVIIYFVTRGKNKTEQEQKDKLNDTVILFVITTVVVLFGKLCLSDNTSTVLVKVNEAKGSQCPF